ncbi:hypothetical protein [Kitasatospora camelliae]|uniref:Uncharacterized protein n=1 Tax=Kitasatospora camelliae TaxID=3156397 RepID=A0AAU8K028_9ACTN
MTQAAQRGGSTTAFLPTRHHLAEPRVPAARRRPDRSAARIARRALAVFTGMRLLRPVPSPSETPQDWYEGH